MNHEAFEDLISAQLDGELSPEEEARLAEHLAVCPACRKAKAEMTAVHGLLSASAAVPPMGLSEKILADLNAQPKKKSPWGRRLAPMIAAAAVVVLVVLGVVKPQLPFDNAAGQEEYSAAAMESAEEAAPEPPAAEEETVTAAEAEEQASPEPAQSYQPPAQDVRPSSSASAPASPRKQETSGGKSDAKADGGGQPSPGAQPDPGTETGGAEPASEDAQTEGSAENAVIPADAEPAEENAEPEEAAPSATEDGGGSEAPDESKTPGVPGALTWQQARERLSDYLGGSPGDLSAEGMSQDGKNWLFTTGGIRYGVNIHTGAVTPLEYTE